MEVKGAIAASWGLVLGSGFGVVHHNGDTLRLLLSVLLLFASLLFANGDMAALNPLIALRQRARTSKFSRRPQRSCSVGEAKPVGHVCDSACSAVRRCAGSGWRRARMNFLA